MTQPLTCACLVYQSDGTKRTCSRRPTHGPYCWQHADGDDGPTLATLAKSPGSAESR